MSSRLHEEISALIEPLIQAMNLTLWGMTIGEGPRKIVRIYIEGPEGVTIDQCAEVSRHIGLALEVEDIVSSAYTLEVSSPGLERPFFSAEQVANYTGKTVDLKLLSPLPEFPGRHSFSGEVVSVDGDNVTLALPEAGSDDSKEIVLNWGAVKKARLVHVFPDTTKGKKGGRQKK